MEINILITSFNDDDINNTIESLLMNANNPKFLKFKILFIDKININEKYLNDKRFEILHLKENKGVGHSRKLLTSNLPKNEYFLQLDSHHRFIKNWDRELIGYYLELKTKHDKIIISTGMPQFNDKLNYFSDCHTISKLNSYTVNGIPKLMTICGESNIETGLICAHFMFSETSLFDEISYSDLWYFFGEEIMLSLLAYKKQYKVFNPHKIIGWHKYKNANFLINRDLKTEKKTYKHIKNEINKLVDDGFLQKIGVDFINHKCSYRNYNIHDSYGYDVIDILTPNNTKIRLYNQGEDIVKFSADGFFKGAVLYDTKNNKKKYFSLTN